MGNFDSYCEILRNFVKILQKPSKVCLTFWLIIDLIRFFLVEKIMFSFIFVMFIIVVCSWIVMKFMYPRPPKGDYMPKAGDNLTPRNCSFCQHSLAEWRGIVDGEHFFCNQEHQADFYAGKTYQAS